jgi:hypothetical protein
MTRNAGMMACAAFSHRMENQFSYTPMASANWSLASEQTRRRLGTNALGITRTSTSVVSMVFPFPIASGRRDSLQPRPTCSGDSFKSCFARNQSKRRQMMCDVIAGKISDARTLNNQLFIKQSSSTSRRIVFLAL